MLRRLALVFAFVAVKAMSEMSHGSCKVCPQSRFNFPIGEQTKNYIRYKSAIPTFTELSVCMWLTPKDAPSDATIISYATSSDDNMFSIYFYDGEFDVYKQTGVEFDFLPESETHICVTLFSPRSSVVVYVNGIKYGEKELDDDRPIEGGGALIFGQDQDEVGGDFEAYQSFSGEIENLMMWYRVLYPAEITMMYESRCNCAAAYDVVLSQERIQIEGGATAIPTLQC